MIKITQRPPKYAFSKNPVQYTFSVTEFADAGCYVQVRIYVRPVGGGVATLLYEEKIKPLYATVDYSIADIVESNLAYALPDFAGTLLQPGQNIKEFYIDFSVITDAIPTAVWISDIATPLTIVKGGIAAPFWDWNNYFINYIPTNKPFLTWQLNNRFIGKNDTFFLSFLNTVATVPLSLIVDAEYTDGTTAQVVTDFADSTQVLYHIQSGPDQLGLNALHTDKMLYKYAVSVVSKADHAVIFANPYTYYIDYRPFYSTKFLHYYNSLGGIECVRIRGEIETNVDVAIADAEKFGGSVIIGSPASEQYTQTAKSKVDSFKGDTGYFHTAKEQDVLQELLLTRFAWERIIGRNMRIYSVTKSAKMRTSTDKIWNFAVEWRYSFTNTVYTPMLDFGTGADQYDYCVKVAIIGTPTMPNAVVGVPFSFTFSLFGDGPITLGAITKPAWATVTLTGKTVTVTGTPTTGVAGTLSIAFTNCTAGTALFTGEVNLLEYEAAMDPEEYTADFVTSADVCTLLMDFTRSADATTSSTAMGSVDIKATYRVDADSGCSVIKDVVFPAGVTTVTVKVIAICEGYCSVATATILSVDIIP